MLNKVNKVSLLKVLTLFRLCPQQPPPTAFVTNRNNQTWLTLSSSQLAGGLGGGGGAAARGKNGKNARQLLDRAQQEHSAYQGHSVPWMRRAVVQILPKCNSCQLRNRNFPSTMLPT